MTGAVGSLAGLAFDLALGLLLLATAIAAVAGRDLFGGVVAFVVYGLLAALAWVRLGAIDVALAEAAIGAGLTGVLLVGAVARLARIGAVDPAPTPLLGKRFAALGATAVAGAIAAAVLALPAERPGLGPEVARSLAASGVENPVTAVLIVFRGYDTLIESIVLLAALVGVWAASVERDWGGLPGLRQHARPGGVMASFARLVPSLGIVIGVYVVHAGAYAPGGAFQGGTILAAVYLLAAMAGLVEPPAVSRLPVRLALALGPAVFLGLGVVGALGGTFLAFPEGVAGTLVLVVETALTVSIAATLALLVLGPPARPPSGGAS
ncbi:hydrogenase subunit MbhD domain-containing protein [Salinarimonas sp.]|uniref:hydrogenase subunit MbhD domain-containing protein n=1 Tax=Salinarimonas sp. TaxID=2766526 RepID=UPI0032D9339C